MKKKWIIIRIETKSREFLSKMLITYELIKKGYGVIITNKLGVDTSIFPIGGYLINCLFENGRKNVISLKKQGHKILLLDEEGLVYTSEEKLLKRVDKQSLEFVDHIYCYGKDQYRIICNNFPEAKTKIFITGNPRMNLLNKKLLGLIADETNEIKSKYGEYILIVSNFTSVNLDGAGGSIEEKKDTTAQILEKMKVCTGKEFDEQYDYILKQFMSMKHLIETISIYYPKFRIIIRPHPSEDINTWTKFSQKFKNVEVIREGSLIPWLLNAILVLENNCTSAIESMYLHVPCISFRPYVSEKYDQPLPNMLSKNVFNENQVLNILERLSKSRENIIDFSEYEKIANQYISYQENDDSIKEIIKHIGELNIAYKGYSKVIFLLRLISPIRIPYILKEAAKSIIKKAPKGLIKILPSRLNQAFIANKQDNGSSKYFGVNKDSIKMKLEKISKVYGENDINIKVSQLGKNIMITTNE